MFYNLRVLLLTRVAQEVYHNADDVTRSLLHRVGLQYKSLTPQPLPATAIHATPPSPLRLLSTTTTIQVMCI